jgi:hypothetical protein
MNSDAKIALLEATKFLGTFEPAVVPTVREVLEILEA